MNEKRIERLEKRQKDTEWSVKFHQKKVKEYQDELVMIKNFLKTLKEGEGQ